jgi:long-chain acyl-CoA synthetase
MNQDTSLRKTLLEDLDHWSAQRPQEPWLTEHWTTHQTTISWAEGAAQVKSAAAGIADRIGQSGKRVGLLCPNNAHWMLADIAIMASGNVLVPLFTTMNADTIKYIADFVDIELLFLGAAENWEQVSACFKPGIPIVRLPGAPDVQGAISWEELIASGTAAPALATPDNLALATIVFTSGTTGLPKGVMHSMSSLREAGHGVGFASGVQPGWRFLSYLPLAHMGERIVVEMNALIFGGTVFFNENLATFLDDLRRTRPQWMLGVPRIWEKLQQAVCAHVLSPEALAEARETGQMDAAKGLVQEFLGLDQAEYILTSTAPTPAPLKAWYDELGIELHDGYGQSEILPISANRKGQRKPGSIGQAAHGAEIRIAEDGEILSRAPGTAMGYFNAPEKTAEVFVADGWVRTGDRGRIDEDGHLFITGRVKEIFKTAKGKYVAPAPIEGRFLDTMLAEQVCLTGLGLAQTVMLIVLSEDARAPEQEHTHAALLAHTAALNETLDKHERIGALILTSTPWAMENGFLTHTLKLKRDQIDEKFAEQIAAAGESMRSGNALFVIRVP